MNPIHPPRFRLARAASPASSIPLARLLCVMILLCSACSAVFGNGYYTPETAIPARPSIPVQRAMILFRDGKETLVVESTGVTQSPTVGWILPLPTQPTRMDKAEPGMLLSLSMSLRPEIVNLSLSDALAPIWLAAVLVPFALAVIGGTTVRSRLGYCGIALLVELPFACCLLPSLSRARGYGDDSPPGIEVISNQVIGSYEVNVLKATSTDSLDHWLSGNSLTPLPPEGKKLVDGYIQQGWVFAVAKIRPDATGQFVPHPLRVEFPASQPVFPMKLTSLAGGRTHVELFVVSNQSASAPGFHRVCSDRFVTVEDVSQSVSTDLHVGNSDARQLLWDNCIITKLEADLTSAQMTADVHITLQPLSVSRVRLYTVDGRQMATLQMAGWAVPAVVIVLAVAGRGQRRPSRRTAMTCAGLVAAAVAASATLYLTAHVDPNIRIERLIKGYMPAGYMSIRSTVQETVAEGGEPQSPGFQKKLITALRSKPETAMNRLTGEAIRWERSPGNVFFAWESENCYVVLFDLDCRQVFLGGVSSATRPTSQP